MTAGREEGGGREQAVRLWGERRVRAGTARAMLGLLVGMA